MACRQTGAALLLWWAGLCAAQPVEIHLSAGFNPASLGLFCTPSSEPWWPTGAERGQRPTRLSPRDCLVSVDNPPVWVWPPHPQAQPGDRYTLHIRHADAGKEDRWQFGSQRPYLYLTERLPAAELHWHVQWHGAQGQSERSATQRLRIDAQAHAINWPSVEAVVAAAAQRARPRLLPDATQWPAVRAAAIEPQGARHDLYSAWQRWAEGLDEQAIAQEPTLAVAPATDDWRRYQTQRSAVQAAGQMYRDIVRLSVLGHLADKPLWRQAAVERLMRLAQWSPEGATSEANEDVANRFATNALAIGYDLLHAELSPEQRARVRTQALRRLDHQHERSFSVLSQGRWPYDSHGVAGVTQAAAMALLLAGESEEHDRHAADLVRWVVPNALAWGEQDGSDANGHFYGWLNQSYAAQAALVLDRVGGLPLQARGVLRNAPLWHAAFTPTPSRALAQRSGFVPSFGDGSDPMHSYAHEYHGTVSRLLADLLPAGPGRSMAQRLWQRTPAQSLRWHQDPLYLLAPLSGATVAPPSDAPATLAFTDSGLVALHSSLDDPARTSVYFRAHHLGAFNHSMADNGAFTLWVAGEPMLVNAGYYDFHGAEHHRRYARRTQAKNALTLDGGRGQLEGDDHEPAQAATPGVRLRAVVQRAEVSLASADLAAAYRPASALKPGADFGARELGAPLLRRYVRTLLRDHARGVTVVIDVADSDTPRSFELNFHALQPWQQQAGVWQTRNAVARVCLRLHEAGAQPWLGEHSDRFLDGRGQEVLPRIAHQRQHHLSLIALEPSTTLRTVTVIQDDCSQTPPEVQWSERGGLLHLVYPDGRLLVVADLS